MIKNLGINQALRYFFCGVILVLSAGYGYGLNWHPEELKSFKDMLVIAALVALVAGAMIYVLYRALLFNLVSRFAFWTAGKADEIPHRFMKWLPFCIPEDEFVTDCWRWKLSDPTGQGAVPAHRAISEWGAQVHMCYTSALAVWIGSLIGARMAGSCRFNCLLFFIFILIILAGFVSHIRLLHIQLRLKRDTE